MAIVNYLLFGDVRGSIAGNVYSRNRFGFYVRNRTVPMNPNTGLQQAARNAFSDAAGYWSQTLTDAERIAWNDYAAAVSVLNKLGQPCYLSGFNMFVRSAALWILVGTTPIEPGPTTLTLPDVDGAFAVSISEATQLISVTFNDGRDWCDEDGAFLSISQMKPVNGSRFYLVGQSRHCGTIDGDSVTPPTSPDDIACSFVATAGQKVIITGRIARADGRLSNLFLASCVVAA
jgi:hypothetical protein